MAQSRRRAIIIGAGIGGVTAAVALLRAGLEVTIYEQAEELREVGAGLTVWPNAMRALQCLGLHEAVWAIGRAFGVGRVHDPHGRVLLEGARREILEKRFGWPGIVLHRHQLLATLAAPLPPAVLRLGARMSGFRQDAIGVAVQFANGAEDQADLLVGADGLHSLTRAQLFGRREPRYAGYAAFRGLVRYPVEDDVAYESWGVGQRFGFVPGPGGDVYWWAAVSGPAGLHSPPATYKQEVLSRYEGWFAKVRTLVEATPETSILRNDIFDRPPARHWSAGRVTLLGDAAHPVTPDLGQGACLAMEDAVVLGRYLAAMPDPATALRAYEAARLRRAAFLARHSRWMGRLGQLRRPWLCRLRNALVPLTPLKVSLTWLSWQFHFEPG
jgi:2-polyprenyl-6-methoxyphenol hydroxylase-like FAD-dependent oxidoreductase